MQETDDMEEIYVQKARFESFDLELKVTQEKVDTVTKLGNQLIANRHPDTDKIRACIQHLLDLWAALQGSADAKRSRLNISHQVNQWHVECQETMTWIKEKVKLIESTEDFGTDLGGVMKLQRRLSGLERDIAAIENRLEMLTAESSRLTEDKPEEALAIRVIAH